jgi:hypothetical protein
MPNSAGIATLPEVLDHCEVPGEFREHLLAALTTREDNLAEAMHMAGQQFGLYPQIVSEVLAELEFGHPKSEQERAVIRHSFNNLMDELRQQQQGG